MEDNSGGLRKRHGLALEENASIVPSDQATCTGKSEQHNGSANGSAIHNDANGEIVMGKTNDGTSRFFFELGPRARQNAQHTLIFFLLIFLSLCSIQSAYDARCDDLVQSVLPQISFRPLVALPTG
jgi:hypothetical protein